MAENEDGKENVKFEYSIWKKVEVKHSERTALKRLSMSLEGDKPSDIEVDKPDKTREYVISVRPQHNRSPVENAPTSIYKCQVCSRTSMRLYVLAHHLRSHFRLGAAQIKLSKRRNKSKVRPTKERIKLSNAVFAKHFTKSAILSTEKAARKRIGSKMLSLKRCKNGDTVLKERNTPEQTEKSNERKRVSTETDAKRTSLRVTDAEPKITKYGKIEPTKTITENKPKVAKRNDKKTPAEQTSRKVNVTKRRYEKEESLSGTKMLRSNAKEIPRENSKNIKSNNSANYSLKQRGRPAAKKSTRNKVSTASSEKLKKKCNIRVANLTRIEPEQIRNIILSDFEESDKKEANVRGEVEKGQNESIQLPSCVATTTTYKASEWDDTAYGYEETDQNDHSLDRSDSISEVSRGNMGLESSIVGNKQSSPNDEPNISVSDGGTGESDAKPESPEKVNNETAAHPEIAGSGAIDEPADLSAIADIQLDSDDEDETKSDEIRSNGIEETKRGEPIGISEIECESDDLSGNAKVLRPRRRECSNGECASREKSPANGSANASKFDEKDEIIRVADIDIEDEIGVPNLGIILDSSANGFSHDENNTFGLITLSDKNGNPVRNYLVLDNQTEFIRRNAILKSVDKAHDELVADDIRILNRVALLKFRSNERSADEEVSENEDDIIEVSD